MFVACIVRVRESYSMWCLSVFTNGKGYLLALSLRGISITVYLQRMKYVRMCIYYRENMPVYLQKVKKIRLL